MMERSDKFDTVGKGKVAASTSGCEGNGQTVFGAKSTKGPKHSPEMLAGLRELAARDAMVYTPKG